MRRRPLSWAGRTVNRGCCDMKPMNHAKPCGLLLTVVLTLLSGSCSGVSPSPDVPAVEVTDSLRELSQYEFGHRRAVLATYEARVRTAQGADAELLEAEMLWILGAEDARFAAKQFACRVLRQVGTERSLPVLGEMLADPHLSHPARYALQGMDAAGVGALLRGTLSRVEGDLRIGVIDSLAARGDRRAVPDLGALIAEGDEPTVRAVLSALGRIGGRDAARIVAATEVGVALPVEKYDALLRCADSMVDEGDEDGARALFQDLAGADHPVACRAAAWRGLLRADPNHALEAIERMLLDSDPALPVAAASFLGELPADVDTAPLARRLWTMPAPARVAALGALSLRGGKATARAAAAALTDEDEVVRIAGLVAMGRTGDARHVGTLLSFTTRSPEEAEAAVKALTELRGEGVDHALLQGLREANDEARAVAIPCLANRRTEGAVNALLGFCSRGNEQVRAASLRGLRALGQPPDLGRLLLLLGMLETPGERGLLGDALLAICRRAEDQDAAAGVLVQSLRDWPAAPRAEILRVLGEMPSTTTLAPLVWSAENGESEVRAAALRALAEWPDSAPREVLHAAMTDAGDRELAMRGYLRLVWLSEELTSADIRRAHEDAYAAAGSAAERGVVIESVARASDPWAIRFLAPLVFADRPGEEAADDEGREAAFLAVTSRVARAVPGDAGGAPVSLANAPVERYTAAGPGTLTDGEWGSTSHTDGKWLGFQGVDLEAVVDLGRDVEVREVHLGYLDNQDSWIFAPQEVEFTLSVDGESWTTPVPRPWAFPRHLQGSSEMPPASVGTKSLWLAEPTTARYVRVKARSIGILPAWHPGAGEEGWLFVDELQVNPRYSE